MVRVVTVDRQAGQAKAAFWITTQGSVSDRSHANAVVVDLEGNTEAARMTRSLTRDCYILITDGTTLDELPVEGSVLHMADIEDLVAITEAHQAAILEAVDDYRERTHSQSIVSPEFPPSPELTHHAPNQDSPPQRALAAANFLAKAWVNWLKTEDERLRRTVRPKTGETPWMMPKGLDQPSVTTLPPAFLVRATLQRKR